MSINLTNQSAGGNPAMVSRQSEEPEVKHPAFGGNLSVTPAGQEAAPAVTNAAATTENATAVPPVSAPDVKADMTAGPVAAPGVMPPNGFVNTDAAADKNTVNYYAKRDAAMAKIKQAIDGELSVSNLDAPNDPAIGKIPLKATEVKIPAMEQDDGRIHAISVGASEIDPLKIELTIPGVDLADPNARREALERLAYKLKFVADNYKPLGHDNHHTPDAVKAEVQSFMTQFPQSASIPTGFTPDEIKLVQKSQNLAVDGNKTDKAYTWGFFGEEEKSLRINFTFNADEKRIEAVKANLEARAEGIKAYFVESLLKSGKIDEAKAAKLKAELVVFAEKTSATPAELEFHMGLPKGAVTNAKSVSELDPAALAAITDDKKALTKAFEVAVAFGEQPGITDKNLKWEATFDMFGPTPFMHFMGDRIARIQENLAPEAKAKLIAEYTALQGEDVLGDWRSRYDLSHKGKPEVDFKVEEGGKVLMTLPVPEGMQRAEMWGKIAGSEITALPTAKDPLPPTNAITPPAVSSGTATPENSAPVTEAQTNTPQTAAPIAETGTNPVAAEQPQISASSTADIANAAPQNIPAMPQAQPGFAAGMTARTPANIASGATPIAPMVKGR